jgi:hypothetical protein
LILARLFKTLSFYAPLMGGKAKSEFWNSFDPTA